MPADESTLGSDTVEFRDEERRARLRNDYFDWAETQYDREWNDGPDFNAADLYDDFTEEYDDADA